MTSFGRCCALGVILAACFTGVATTADVRIEGSWSYRISGDEVTVEVDRIVNYSSTHTTGTLYLTLWLTSSADRYTTGHSAARVSLYALDGDGRLRPNYQYENVRLTTPYTEPAAGTYYVHLYVSQWPDLDTTLDLWTATNTLTVEPETVSRVRMFGSLSYSVTGGELTLGVERIENLGRYRTSGTLYLTMWLTAGPDPYTTGHVAGRASLAGAYGDNGTLPPGSSFHDVSLTMPYTAPPPGTYYVHLYVSEWPDRDTTLDLFTFTDTFTVEPEEFTRIDMVGTISYLISGGEVTLEVEQITNTGNYWTSGTLHLTLWLTATPDPYTTGYTAGRASLGGRYGDNGTLASGDSFYNVRLTMPYTEPPPGAYYVHLYTSEHPDLDTALDLETFTNPLELAQDDHGDEPSGATPVSARSTTEGEIQWRGDVDVFRVRIADSGTLRASTSGNTDTRGELSNELGQVVATDDDSGERLNFHISQSVGPGSWYIAVRGFSRSTVGSYVLTVDFERDAPTGGTDPASIAGSHLGDFDGDGSDDVLLRHADGRWYLYPMEGRWAKASRGTVRLTEDLDYHVAGIGDFNGDGQDDVLVRHTAGAWHYYPMDGRRVLAGAGPAAISMDVEYEVAGIGDFNGDGRDDVLLRHSDGHWRYYPMNGRVVADDGASSANLTANTDFKVVGIGDFNGDGRDDVLLRRSDGRWHYYPMNGARTISGRGAAPLTRDIAYSVIGAADFDGDGRDDVMLRHMDGGWHYYRLDGRVIMAGSGSASLTKNTDYRVAGVGDLDGDGRGDLLLRHVDGRWYYYPMNGRRAGSGRGTAQLTRDLQWAIPRPPQPPVQTAGTISGTLAVAPGQVLDGDTPDPDNPRVENDTFASAQRLPSPVSVAGHASEADDALDFYLLTFPAPTQISLAIADTDADLDLFLADTGGNILAGSLGVDDLEAIQTELTGDHILVVSAYSGASNYTLVAATSTATGLSNAAASTRPKPTSRDGEFLPGELIVKVPAAEVAPLATMPSDAMSSLMQMGLAPHAATPSGAILVRSEGTRPFPLTEVPALRSGLRYADTELRDRAVTMLRRKQLLASGRFDAVQPNYIYRAMATPTDPYFRHQWHYPFIGLPQAWDTTTGNDNVVVAVIDTGVVTDHPDLASRLLRDAGNQPAGYDFIEDPNRAADGDGIDPNPYDVGDREVFGEASSFHGTHVAGTIGAATNNGKGVAGVMWRGRLMPIRVLGRGGGSSLDIAEGIRYAAGLPNVSGTVPPRPADIINLSLGSPNPDCEPYRPVDTATRTAIEDAIDSRAIVVVAAGNDDCHWPDPMTTIAGVVSVGATDQHGRAPYSNFGAELDVVAPGGNLQADVNGDGFADGVISVSADDSGSGTQPAYHPKQGTSMAAPHVAGVFGLMLSVNPRLEPADISRLLDGTHPDPAAAPITRDWGVPGRDDEFGNGLIDASRAVRVARAIRGGDVDDTPDGPVLAVSPTRLHFDSTAEVLRTELSNVGTGTLSTRSVLPDRTWMSVSFDEWPTVVVNVDRTGLSEGTFAGRIQIDSDGGSVGVPVTMRVERTVRHADVGRLYVLAMEPDTYELRAHTATSAREGYAFALPELPAGQYVIAAGTDRDDDGYICDAGEACGVWPLRDSPGVVELDGDRRVDFGVSIDLFASIVSQSVRTSRIAPNGFRRIAAP